MGTMPAAEAMLKASPPDLCLGDLLLKSESLVRMHQSIKVNFKTK